MRVCDTKSNMSAIRFNTRNVRKHVRKKGFVLADAKG